MFTASLHIVSLEIGHYKEHTLLGSDRITAPVQTPVLQGTLIDATCVCLYSANRVDPTCLERNFVTLDIKTDIHKCCRGDLKYRWIILVARENIHRAVFFGRAIEIRQISPRY